MNEIKIKVVQNAYDEPCYEDVCPVCNKIILNHANIEFLKGIAVCMFCYDKRKGSDG